MKTYCRVRPRKRFEIALDLLRRERDPIHHHVERQAGERARRPRRVIHIHRERLHSRGQVRRLPPPCGQRQVEMPRSAASAVHAVLITPVPPMNRTLMQSLYHVRVNHTVTSERYTTRELHYADPDRYFPRPRGLVPPAHSSDGRVHRRSERARREDAIRPRGARARRQDHARRPHRRSSCGPRSGRATPIRRCA